VWERGGKRCNKGKLVGKYIPLRKKDYSFKQGKTLQKYIGN